MRFDWRPENESFAGIELQEYDRATQSLLGEPRTISVGTAAGVAEGPHLHRRDGWYYLVHAEGGTGYEHGSAVARSCNLFGPYEPDPAGPLLTSRHDPMLELQKAGHCSLVKTEAGEWYAAHIVARPYGERGRCVIGRETALPPVSWTADSWPRVAGGARPWPFRPRRSRPHPFPTSPERTASASSVATGPPCAARRTPTESNRRRDDCASGRPVPGRPPHPQSARPPGDRHSLHLRNRAGLRAPYPRPPGRAHRLLQHPQLALPVCHRRGRRHPRAAGPDLRGRTPHRTRAHDPPGTGPSGGPARRTGRPRPAVRPRHRCRAPGAAPRTGRHDPLRRIRGRVPRRAAAGPRLHRSHAGAVGTGPRRLGRPADFGYATYLEAGE